MELGKILLSAVIQTQKDKRQMPSLVRGSYLQANFSLWYTNLITENRNQSKCRVVEPSPTQRIYEHSYTYGSGNISGGEERL